MAMEFIVKDEKFVKEMAENFVSYVNASLRNGLVKIFDIPFVLDTQAVNDIMEGYNHSGWDVTLDTNRNSDRILVFNI